MGKEVKYNEKTDRIISETLTRNERAVIPGFYGSMPDGSIRTFSRGGSDITGSIVAKAVHADMYENWTDVSGIYRADPRIVENAEVIPELSYKEVRELSDVGATVFHEEAIAPIYGIGIPIVVKNTNKPEDPGTKIIDADDVKGPCGVSARGGLSRIRLRKLMLFKKYGMRHALLTMLHIFGIRPCYSLFGIDSIVWFFDSKMASDSVCQAMCERLTKEFGLDAITVDHGHAILGIAGGDMDTSDVYLDAATTLRESNIETTFVNYGSSDASVLIGIKEEQAADAVKVVYSKLF